MTHYSSIDTESIHQQEVMPGFRSWLDLSRMRFLISSILLVPLNSTGKGERFHFDMPYVTLRHSLLTSVRAAFTGSAGIPISLAQTLAVPPGIRPTMLCC